MRTDRCCAVFASVATLILGSAGHAQQRFPVPPPPPPVYHPIPGPFLVMIDSRGEMESGQIGVVDNAWSSWRGPKLEAYSICYFQTSPSKHDWTAVLRALENVSAALKTRGAVVFTPWSRICDAAHPSVPAGKSYVQIVGIMRT